MTRSVHVALPNCTLTVYHADTDAGGVAHHTAYLRWFERARADWLTALGLGTGRLDREHGVAFAVIEANLRFHKPAELDDALSIGGSVTADARGLVTADQVASRDDQVLVRGNFRLACVRISTRTLTALPAPLKRALFGHDGHDADDGSAQRTATPRLETLP